MQKSTCLSHISINADLGEGMGNDKELMPYLDLCNIACGGHFGDQKTISETMDCAIKHKVKMGAHPAYPDTENFGRSSLDMNLHDLLNSLTTQIQLVYDVAKSKNSVVHHIKPHGALYHDVAKNSTTATIFIKAVEELKVKPKIVLPFRAKTISLFTTHFDVIREAFIDRRYDQELNLVSRQSENGVIFDMKEAYLQLLCMVNNNTIKTTAGSMEKMEAETFCIHGDHPNALNILKYIHKELKNDTEK